MERREFLRYSALGLTAIWLKACVPFSDNTPSVTKPILPAPSLTPPPTPLAEAKDVLSPRKVEEQPESLFMLLMQPLIKEAEKRRYERSFTDPEHSYRVDSVLNKGRVNILLFGYGDSYEPPNEKLEIASPTIFSIDYEKGAIDLISLTHDIYDPFIAEVLGIKGEKESATRLDQLILNKEAVAKLGKFKLPQISLEKATGLSIDFQLHFHDSSVQRFVDEVLGGLSVDIPVDMPLQAYWHEGQKYDEKGRIFKAGKVNLSGREAEGFIKSIPQYGPGDKEYSYKMEHRFREGLIFEAIKDKFFKDIENNELKGRVLLFFGRELLLGKAAYDFDILKLGQENFIDSFDKLVDYKKEGKTIKLGIPSFRYKLYVVDRCCGPADGPVHWVDGTKGRPGEGSVEKDFQNGVFKKRLGYEVPYGGDPYSKDLIAGYWMPIRLWVRRKLINR